VSVEKFGRPVLLGGSILVDTGPIVAILSEPDEHHEVCVAQLSRLTGPLLTQVRHYFDSFRRF
jgi:hypothetical protein